MRHAFIAIVGFLAFSLVSGTASQSAPGPAQAQALSAAGGVVQKIENDHHHLFRDWHLDWHHYYRREGDHWNRHYQYRHEVRPVRPLSCGEFRFWDGERCVDVRQSSPSTRTVRGRAVNR